MFGAWLSKMKMMRAYVSGDLSAAIKHAQECLTKNNQDIGVLWTLAECFRLQGELEEAIAYGRKAFSVDPNHMDTLQLLTELYFDREDYQHTYEYARSAVSLAKERDLELQPYIDKVKESLSSSKLMSVSAPSIMHSIDKEQKTTKDWITWAMEFMAWYESTQRAYGRTAGKL